MENSENVIEPIVESSEVVEQQVATADTTAVAPKATKASLIERLSALLGGDADQISRDEVAHIKQQFYALRHAEIDAQLAEYAAANDGSGDGFVVAEDPVEINFKELLNDIKEKKAEALRAAEALREANLDRKKAIIAEIEDLAADTDNVNRQFPRMRELQAEFKEVGDVPPTETTQIWKAYQEATERFYDQLKVNQELRDYDFRKNLEQKELLCSQAEALADEADVITAFRRLQELHDKWRETGPVAKENREQIWVRFKDASAVVNKRYQAFFEERKAREQANEEAKTALCAEMETIDVSQIKGFSQWEEATRRVLDMQARWKQLGFASKKLNNALYDRFRSLCDNFFAAKSAYFKSVRTALDENLRLKTELCEKAEALSESSDWKATADALVDMQKEWKKIGAVPKKVSDALWKRFTAACDKFFARKKEQAGEKRSEEHANLKTKREIIATLSDLTAETDRDQAVATIKQAQSQWNATGHVPFRDKDKINDQYRELIARLTETFDLREQRASMNRFEENIAEIAGDKARLDRERERLMRAYEARKSEIATCENNLGFFTSKSGSGNSMLRDLERRIQRLRDDLKQLEKKINYIDKL